MPRSKKRGRPRKFREFGTILCTCYWLRWAKFSADGTLVIHTTWPLEDGSHIDGATKVKPDEPDYPLWQWLLKRWAEGSSRPDYINNTELDEYRAMFVTSDPLGSD